VLIVAPRFAPRRLRYCRPRSSRVGRRYSGTWSSHRSLGRPRVARDESIAWSLLRANRVRRSLRDTQNRSRTV